MTPNMARNTPLTVEKINTGRPGLANLTVKLALNLCLEGIVTQRRARLARGANMAQPIRIDRGMKQHLVAIVALRPYAAQGLG